MRLTDGQLRDFYRAEYVEHHAQVGSARLARLLPLIDWQPDDRVLDCACGSGQLLELMHDRVARYVGVDFSDEFIRKCAEQQAKLDITNADFVCSDLAEYCLAHPGEFDKCFAFDFSEHIYDDEFVRIFRAIHISLKVGGKLYIHTPNADYFLERLKSTGVLKNDPTHIGVRHGAYTARLLSESGFGSPRIEYLAHYAKPLKRLHFLSSVPGVGYLFQARLFITCVKSATIHVGAAPRFEDAALVGS